jgi:hypothetical protein
MSIYNAIESKGKIYILYDTCAGTLPVPIEVFRNAMEKANEVFSYVIVSNYYQ